MIPATNTPLTPEQIAEEKAATERANIANAASAIAYIYFSKTPPSPFQPRNLPPQDIKTYQEIKDFYAKNPESAAKLITLFNSNRAAYETQLDLDKWAEVVRTETTTFFKTKSGLKPGDQTRFLNDNRAMGDVLIPYEMEEIGEGTEFKSIIDADGDTQPLTTEIVKKTSAVVNNKLIQTGLLSKIVADNQEALSVLYPGEAESKRAELLKKDIIAGLFLPMGNHMYEGGYEQKIGKMNAYAKIQDVFIAHLEQQIIGPDSEKTSIARWREEGNQEKEFADTVLAKVEKLKNQEPQELDDEARNFHSTLKQKYSADSAQSPLESLETMATLQKDKAEEKIQRAVTNQRKIDQWTTNGLLEDNGRSFETAMEAICQSPEKLDFIGKGEQSERNKELGTYDAAKIGMPQPELNIDEYNIADSELTFIEHIKNTIQSIASAFSQMASRIYDKLFSSTSTKKTEEIELLVSTFSKHAPDILAPVIAAHQNDANPVPPAKRKVSPAVNTVNPPRKVNVLPSAAFAKGRQSHHLLAEPHIHNRRINNPINRTQASMSHDSSQQNSDQNAASKQTPLQLLAQSVEDKKQNKDSSSEILQPTADIAPPDTHLQFGKNLHDEEQDRLVVIIKPPIQSQEPPPSGPAPAA